jgi:NADPH:quinone reductase-like Zn-dependent oxidoreductase
VNPYDRICQKDEASNEGFTLGCDGCGIVEAVGEGVDGTQWVGKKVAFLGGGWARYAVKDVGYLVKFADDFDLKNGANTYVNPFTVTAMLDIAQKRGAKAVILLAASSALAKQFIRLA